MTAFTINPLPLLGGSRFARNDVVETVDTSIGITLNAALVLAVK